MIFVLLTIATFLAFQLVQLAYVVSLAIVGHWFGATARAISIGYGPCLWSFMIGEIEWRVSAIPTGSYTQFLGPQDLKDEHDLDAAIAKRAVNRVAYENLSIGHRFVILMSGPLSTIAIGLACVTIPVGLGADQLVVGPHVETPIQPRAVPLLGIDSEASTWNGQEQVFQRTFITFWQRLLTFQSMNGWGTFVGWLVTSAAAATVSPPAWLTCFGVVCVGVGTLNLIPIPGLIGGQLLFLLLEAAYGPLSEKLVVWMTLLGILISYVILIYLFLIDVGWCIKTIGGQ